MLVRIANREDPDQTASSDQPCLSRPFGMQLLFEILEHLPYCVRMVLVLWYAIYS